MFTINLPQNCFYEFSIDIKQIVNKIWAQRGYRFKATDTVVEIWAIFQEIWKKFWGSKMRS